MTEHMGFLADILENPADDFPRLVYADWLEDHGEEERAEFIRAQVELAVVLAIEHDCGPDGEGETTCPACGAVGHAQELLAAEDDLVRSDAWRWLRDGLPPRLYQDFDRWRHHGGRIDSKRDDDLSVAFSRGFLAAVRCPLAAWEEHGPAIVSRHPVERVELSDITTAVEDETAPPGHWWVGDANDGSRVYGYLSPGTLYGYLHRLEHHRLPRSRAELIDLLSGGCLAWARDEARRRGLWPCGAKEATA